MGKHTSGSLVEGGSSTSILGISESAAGVGTVTALALRSQDITQECRSSTVVAGARVTALGRLVQGALGTRMQSILVMVGLVDVFDDIHLRDSQ